MVPSQYDSADLLRRKRIWLDEEDSDEDPVAERSPLLAHVARASLAGTLAFGPTGARPVRLRDAQPRTVPQAERAGKSLGFVLDAEVRVSAWTIRAQRIAYITQPWIITAILEWAERKEEPP